VKQEPSIIHLREVDARKVEHDWAWPRENGAAIAANWARRTADKPKMFNGRVFVLRQMSIDGDCARCGYAEVDFRDFISWIDMGFPDDTIANGFAAGALMGSDGAFICGVMGKDTANAGRVYFASGTPDLDDLRSDGSLDLGESLLRELVEETALAPHEFEITNEWILVRTWPTYAFIRYVKARVPAQVLAERIRANIAKQKDPELDDVVVIHGVNDISEKAMPVYVQRFFQWHFGRG
jgi:hypothetical protein